MHETQNAMIPEGMRENHGDLKYRPSRRGLTSETAGLNFDTTVMHLVLDVTKFCI